MLGVYTDGDFGQLYPAGAAESVLFKRAHGADVLPDLADVAPGFEQGFPCLVRDWGALQRRPDLLLPLTEWDTAGLMVHVRGAGVAHVLTVRTICRSYQPMQVIPFGGDEHIFSIRDEWGKALELRRIASYRQGPGEIDFSHGQVIRLVGFPRGALVRFTAHYGVDDSVTFEVKLK